MNQTFSTYLNPLDERYTSAEMSYIFSPRYKFSTWRKLWVALEKAQKELGLDISAEQITEMENNIDNLDLEKAKAYEAKTRHDVMAHIHAFGDVCPLARPIIHLGATSAFVGDNTDLIQTKAACTLVIQRLLSVIESLGAFSLAQKDTATLGFTHFQPAQLVTVGKRASLWLLELTMDFVAMERYLSDIPLLGSKGTTGTQASFLSLFNGDHDKVKKLDELVAKQMGFATIVPVSGQTYSRKIDYQALSVLCGLAQSLHKMANDIRLLQHLKEVEEPFEKTQVGSSAMAYKRNPMRSERLTSLARFVMSLESSTAMTAAEQWFERTLDDSANKRLALPQAFMAIDAMLIIAKNVCSGLVVYPEVINKHIAEELPFMATENILMEAVKRGGDRQTLHEAIRVHSMEAGRQVKEFGKSNDLLDRIAQDPQFGMNKAALDKLLNVKEFIGRSPEQVEEFYAECITPILAKKKVYGEVAVRDLKV